MSRWTTRVFAPVAVVLCLPVGAIAQNVAAQPTYGTVNLRAGFTPDPSVHAVTAGGAQLTQLGGCNAYIHAAAPDLDLNYTAGSLPLSIEARSGTDVTVLVNAPDGSWHCDDDGGDGTNARLTFPRPTTGQYNIWVGTYAAQAGNLPPAEIRITEMGAAPTGGGALDVNLPANYGAINLSAGFSPDPTTRSIVAGGSVQVPNNASGCAGFVSAAPDLELTYQAGGYQLNLYAESNDDITLVVNAPDGTWWCSDDVSGTNPHINFANPRSGTYDIWIGTYRSGTQPASLLSISEAAPRWGSAVATQPSPAVTQPVVPQQQAALPQQQAVVPQPQAAAPGAVAGIPVTPAPAAAPLGATAVVDIFEPAAWAGQATRGIQAVQRTSLRIRGAIAYTEEIGRVTFNGVPGILIKNDDGTQGTFQGVVEVTEDLRAVTLSVFAADGRQIGEETYPVEPAAPTLAPTVHAQLPFEEMQRARGERYALIIGISEYQDSAIRDLEYADDDARAIYEFLASPAAGMNGIPRENMRLLVDEQADILSIKDALAELQSRADEDDVVIFYLAAHGVTDPRNGYFILAHNTLHNQLVSRGLPMNEITESLGRTEAHMKIAFVDACHAGGMGERTSRAVDNNIANELFVESMRSSPGGWVTFTAAEGAQESAEGEEWGGGHGVFTWFLLEGMRGLADLNGDRVVNIDELFEYTRDEVASATGRRQIPKVDGAAFDRLWPMAVVSQ